MFCVGGCGEVPAGAALAEVATCVYKLRLVGELEPAVGGARYGASKPAEHE